VEDWNVKLYGQFEKERAQPSIDLINRIEADSLQKIIDIGCGSGMSTIPLRNRFKKAEITGVDFSTSMLNKAKEMMSDVIWLQRNCSKPLTDLGKFDLVFSNAALQWLGNQRKVIKNLSDILLPDGLLAVQVPYFSAMTIENCIKDVVKTYKADIFNGIEEELFKCYPPAFYYNELGRHFAEIDLWQTNYFHIMNTHEEILEFCKSTGLRPYVERLEASEREEFYQRILDEIKKQYATQENGRVLFEFKRIFFIAKK